MKINVLEDVFAVAKLLKADYVYIKDNYIYGVDSNFVYFKTMRFDNIHNITIAFSINNMSAFIKGIGMNEIKCYDNLLYSSFDNTCNINNMDAIYNIMRIHEDMFHIWNNCKLAAIDVPLRGNEAFEQIVSLKTIQGTKRFIYDRFSMTMCNNLVPVNKSDKVNLNIYDLTDNTFLSVFTVAKGKKYIIDVYIRYKHLF